MKDVIGYKGRYKVTADGRVWSEYSKKFLKIHVCNKNGYALITMTVNWVRKTESVHRLVAGAFIQNVNNQPCVNHKDGNKLNNNMNNLEWVSYSENSKHAFATGLTSPRKGGDHAQAKGISLFDTKTSKCLHEFDCISTAAKELKVNKTSIYRVLNGQRESMKGMHIFYKTY